MLCFSPEILTVQNVWKSYGNLGDASRKSLRFYLYFHFMPFCWCSVDGLCSKLVLVWDLFFCFQCHHYSFSTFCFNIFSSLSFSFIHKEREKNTKNKKTHRCIKGFKVSFRLIHNLSLLLGRED